MNSICHSAVPQTPCGNGASRAVSQKNCTRLARRNSGGLTTARCGVLRCDVLPPPHGTLGKSHRPHQPFHHAFGNAADAFKVSSQRGLIGFASPPDGGRASSQTRSPSFLFFKTQNTHLGLLPFQFPFIADWKRNGSGFACLKKSFANLQKRSAA